MKKRQSGQGLMEYMMVGTLVGIFCLLSVKKFGEDIRNRVDMMSKKIRTHIDLP